jgi:fructose/tagatose bisphosphate aldolase
MSVLLERAAAEGYAVPALRVWNSETMDAVVRTAEALKAPVVLMSGPGELGLLGGHCPHIGQAIQCAGSTPCLPPIR